MPLLDYAAQAGSAIKAVAEASSDLLIQPTLRLGVTGLARSGKTVFTTALVHHLVEGHALPAFEPAQAGRLRRARLVPQPDDDVPRFPFEENFSALTEARRWPGSTDRISQLRLAIEYERAGGWRTGPGTLMLDVVDYPGEWLLDLALLDQSYVAWSRATILGTRRAGRSAIAAPWLAAMAGLDAGAPLDEVVAERAANAFKTYLSALRAGAEAVATTPPGRFLMPGDLAGSPMLTFAPLDRLEEVQTPGSLGALMERRFEAYKAKVVEPFFREHVQRVDRQIVLVDVLSAVDAGPAALAELEEALDAVLLAFRVGRNSLLTRFFAPRADRILFAATKADHIHHTSHDRLEAALGALTRRAGERATFQGAEIKALALAALQSTREADVLAGGEALACIVGIPMTGERVGETVFDGKTAHRVYPGEVPADVARLAELPADAISEDALTLVRFQPARVAPDGPGGERAPWPHIRLDRGLDFLLGDRLA